MGNPYTNHVTNHLLRIQVPFPKSLRSNGKVPESYRALVAAKCAGLRLSQEQEIAVTMHFYGKWKDSKDKRRRRDHINYVCTLIDVLCACLGIDDSAVVHWKDLIKIHKPHGPEYVDITLTPARMR